jgi:hypothetical protein
MAADYVTRPLRSPNYPRAWPTEWNQRHMFLRPDFVGVRTSALSLPAPDVTTGKVTHVTLRR